MYFDFEDYRPETPTIARAVSWREGVLFSFVLHLVFFAAILVISQFPLSHLSPEALKRQQKLQLAREREARRFVFVAPRSDIEALKPKPHAEDSDKNRVGQSPERAKAPTNPLPFARGNSQERVEALERERARGQGPTPEPARGAEDNRGAASDANGSGSNRLPNIAAAPDLGQPSTGSQRGSSGTAPTPGGSLGEALRNLQRYVQHDSLENQSGGTGQFGPSIQFDTKGVEFGPWIRRFIAQIKRNWFIPYAAMSLKGHTVITFYVHKDGTISELAVPGPSPVDAFNHSAFNALVASNPTQPLPPEYPSDRAFFTITFYYNETPPAQ